MTPRDWALVVGINAYPEMGALQGAEADARNFHDWVTDPAGGGIDDPSKAVLILSQPSASGDVYDAMPARYEIEKFFYKVDAAANANGLVAGRRLYMFFSGHGFAPSFDQSAILMANATRTAPDNFACRNWADRLFQGGWFEEVILFQDTCRTRFTAGTLIPSFFSVRNAPGQARFYALAGQDGKLALEKPDGAGGTRGVFSMTLMEALRGKARDRETGALTSYGLLQYLQTNMKTWYSAADLARDDVAQVPDVYCPIPFEVLPPASVPTFPVHVTLAASNLAAQIIGPDLAPIAQSPGRPDWSLALPVGFYKLTAAGSPGKLFEVTGRAQEAVDVAF